MTQNEFFDELGRIFDKVPKDEQLAVYRSKLSRFSPEQLVEILNACIEECRIYPKVSDLFKAANSLGYLHVDTTRTRAHHWQPTEECSACHGEGRLAIFWLITFQEREHSRVEIQTLHKILPYSKSFDYRMEPGEFRTVFRCRCKFGDADTIPKSWPKLGRNTPTQREVWV